MALPLIPFAGAIGSLLATAFGSIVLFLATIVGKKIAVGATLGAFLVAGWIAIQAAMIAAWTSLAWSIPGDLVVPLGFVNHLLPANTALCMQVVIVAKMGRWLWDNQQDWAKATAQS